MEDPKDLVRRAADLIEQHGHTTGWYGAPETGFCVGGALWYCLRGVPRGVALPGSRPMTKEEVDLYSNAVELVENHVGRGITAWNDYGGHDREGVVRILREVAA